MEIKTYLRFYGDMGSTYLEPVEDFIWTGRWKIETIDGETILYCERKWKLFGLFPVGTTWVPDNEFVEREEEIYINECVGELSSVGI